MGNNYFDVNYLDTLAAGRSPLHRLDPRAKLITTLLFIVTVVSFDKYALVAFIPFLVYPLVLISVGNLPAWYLLKRVLFVAPFAVLVGIFNPVMDREIIFHIGSMGITAGWVSFASILVRFFLTVTAALLLIALTGFNAVCEALLRLGVPRPLVVQLLFFYRYLFILGEESQRMQRARSLRSFHRGAVPYGIFIPMIGHLLLRTFDRSERIYQAMCCRGFDGHIPMAGSIKISRKDCAFVLIWGFLFVVLRLYNVPLMIGEFLAGGFR